MLKNQKLAITAAVALAIGFGAFKALSDTDNVKASPTTKVKKEVTVADRKKKQTEIYLQDVEMPEGLNKVEQALDDRWGHLGEEVLTSSSINSSGDSVFYDKELKPAFRSDGSVLWVQAAHQAHLFNGKVVKSVKNKPVIASIELPKKGNKGFFSRLMQRGGEVDRNEAPEAKAPR